MTPPNVVTVVKNIALNRLTAPSTITFRSVYPANDALLLISSTMMSEAFTLTPTVPKSPIKAIKTDKIKCCFTIGANELTKPGNKDVFLRIIDPSGKVLTPKEDKANMFEFDGVRGLYSVKKEVMYENKDVDVCMYWEVLEELSSGKYIVYAYTDGHEIGVTEFTLK